MSAKGFWVSQDGHLCQLIPPQSVGNAAATARFSLADYAHASILLQLGAAGGPCGAVTLNVFKAASGGAGVAIPFRLVKYEQASGPYDVQTNNPLTNNAIFYEPSTGFTPGEVSSEDIAEAMYILEVEGADLLAAGNGTYVEVDIAAGSLYGSPLLLSAVAILSGGRITGDQTASAQV